MSADYEVGYGKPPRHTRFRKGQSGNPGGRPKGSANLSTLAERELKQRIVIREGGVERRIPKGGAVIKAQTNKAIKGDTRAAEFLHKLTDTPLRVDHGSAEIPLTREEEQLLQRLLADGLPKEPPLPDEGETNEN